MFLVISV